MVLQCRGRSSTHPSLRGILKKVKDTVVAINRSINQSTHSTLQDPEESEGHVWGAHHHRRPRALAGGARGAGAGRRAGWPPHARRAVRQPPRPPPRVPSCCAPCCTAPGRPLRQPNTCSGARPSLRPLRHPCATPTIFVLVSFVRVPPPSRQVADIIQIPAFLCRQTDLLVAAAKTGWVRTWRPPAVLVALQLSGLFARQPQSHPNCSPAAATAARSSRSRRASSAPPQ